MSVLSQDVNPKFTSLLSVIVVFFLMPFLLYGVYQVSQFVTKATGKPASIMVDTKQIIGTIDPSFYHAFAQGGEEKTDMIAPVLGDTKALKPKMIRLDHIYDYFDIVGKSGETLTYDFSKFDAAIRTILATGAKPLLSLSYMPPAIARDGSVINPPDRWENWSDVVKNTIEHVSGKNGLNIAGVYYEVWNEPDLAAFGKWGLSGEKNYLTLYKYADIGASRAEHTNTFFLGGPATTGLYKNWIVALAQSGYRVDFFSWHSYLQDPGRFATDQANFASWLRSDPQKMVLPTLITEFGFTGSKDKRYGGTYGAAFTASVIRELISGGPTYLFSFQIKDGPNQNSGDGWGLLAHESAGKQKKPRYYVYSFLDQLAGNRILLSGEGTWVKGLASTNNQGIRIALINFDTNGNHIETVPVTVQNLDNGTYLTRVRYLFQNGCSIDSPPVKNPPHTDTVAAGTFVKNICISPHNVALVELTKQ